MSRSQLQTVKGTSNCQTLILHLWTEQGFELANKLFAAGWKVVFCADKMLCQQKSQWGEHGVISIRRICSGACGELDESSLGVRGGVSSMLSENIVMTNSIAHPSHEWYGGGKCSSR